MRPRTIPEVLRELDEDAEAWRRIGTPEALRMERRVRWTIARLASAGVVVLSPAAFGEEEGAKPSEREWTLARYIHSIAVVRGEVGAVEWECLKGAEQEGWRRRAFRWLERPTIGGALGASFRAACASLRSPLDLRVPARHAVVAGTALFVAGLARYRDGRIDEVDVVPCPDEPESLVVVARWGDSSSMRKVPVVDGVSFNDLASTVLDELEREARAGLDEETVDLPQRGEAVPAPPPSGLIPAELWEAAARRAEVELEALRSSEHGPTIRETLTQAQIFAESARAARASGQHEEARDEVLGMVAHGLLILAGGDVLEDDGGSHG